MGGLIRSQNVRGDLWLVEGGTSSISAYPVVTTSEGPGPRVGHASLLVGNAFIGKYMALFLLFFYNFLLKLNQSNEN